MNTQMQNRDSIWRIAPSVRCSFDRDGCVVLDMKKGVFYSANAFGSKIWELIKEIPQEITVRGLLDRLPAEIEAPRDEVQRDIEQYLRELAAQGLLIGDTPTA
jgi:hypothetical protein